MRIPLIFAGLAAFLLGILLTLRGPAFIIGLPMVLISFVLFYLGLVMPHHEVL